MNDGYELLDSGCGRKLERFGAVTLSRPCSQAVWQPKRPQPEWDAASAAFDREDGNRWHNRAALPEHWNAEIGGIRLKLSGTDFGHLGVFPEQRAQWDWIRETIRASGIAHPQVLNLFAYSGGSTLAAAQAGAEVCHLDASRGMVQWARENAALNDLASAPIRWIVDDAHKFLTREARRNRKYDAFILDPPTFGRGNAGELYKIERDLPKTLGLCRSLMSDKPLFVLLSAHTPGFSPIVLQNILGEFVPSGGKLESGEMLLSGAPSALSAPSGAFARWHA